MNIRFISNDTSGDKFTGFQANWTATFEPPTYRRSFSGYGCENCMFPFVSEGRRYDTCVSKDDEDSPWCLSGFTQPTEEGTHVSLMPGSKVLCTETDSSCPSLPQISAHPSNQPGDCCKCVCCHLHKQIKFYFCRLWTAEQKRCRH